MTELTLSAGATDEARQARQLALKMLAARSLSVEELRRKLHQHKISRETADEVISQFLEKGYLDDRAFSELFIGSQLRRRPYGRQWFAVRLLRKGVDRQTIKAALDEAYGQADEYELARRAASEKLRSLKGASPQTLPGKLARFLRNRGFSNEVILRLVEDHQELQPGVDSEDG